MDMNRAVKRIRKNNLKSIFDDIPDMLYIDVGGKDILFKKEEYPTGVRWLPANDKIRFYNVDGEYVFPCLEFPDYSDGKAMFLWEMEGWSNDYYGKTIDYIGGMQAVIEFEDFLKESLADGEVYPDDDREYSDE